MREIAREVSVTPVPPSSYAGDVRWELAQRVAASTLFKKSPRLRQFLLFVAERSVAGHAADISEYEIGWKVFERGPNYNPVDDSIVRSAARQLRASAPLGGADQRITADTTTRGCGVRDSAQPWGIRLNDRGRRRADSNRCARLCRPLPNHSATAPGVRTSYPAL